jgi:hypothetical protein
MDRGIISPASTSLLLLLTLTTTKHASNVTPSALRASCNTARTALHSIRSTLAIATQWALSLDGLALFILAAAFSTIDTLFGDGVTEGLCDSSFANLAADEAVHTVLEVVDLGYACDFGLVEVLFRRCVRDM